MQVRDASANGKKVGQSKGSGGLQSWKVGELREFSYGGRHNSDACVRGRRSDGARRFKEGSRPGEVRKWEAESRGSERERNLRLRFCFILTTPSGDDRGEGFAGNDVSSAASTGFLVRQSEDFIQDFGEFQQKNVRDLRIWQKQIVALVCNFPNSRGSSISKLNHWDVETLFHEFGHALHSLFSRTDYQHFSGTRVVLDFAETPSNLFEYYAWDYRVLKTFARHYSTGEVIPEKLVDSMNRARNMFSAMELQRQILYSLIDLTLFGEQPASPMDTISIVADLKRQCTSWKHVEGTHWHTRFSHLINYGAGYYTYLYAKCFAATIWEKVCRDDPLSLSTGTAMRTKLLQHGGAKDPSNLLRDLAGHSILRSYNGGIVPDTSSLCKEMNL